MTETERQTEREIDREIEREIEREMHKLTTIKSSGLQEVPSQRIN